MPDTKDFLHRSAELSRDMAKNATHHLSRAGRAAAKQVRREAHQIKHQASSRYRDL